MKGRMLSVAELKSIVALDGCWPVTHILKEGVDYVDVTNEHSKPVDENILVEGKPFRLAGMQPVAGYPCAVSVCYKSESCK